MISPICGILKENKQSKTTNQNNKTIKLRDTENRWQLPEAGGGRACKMSEGG